MFSAFIQMYMVVIFLSTAAASVFKPTVLVDGVSIIKCAVEHQLLISMKQMIISYKFVTHYSKNTFMCEVLFCS